MDCACGQTEAHQIARRRTADNLAVVLWSDGRLTGAFGALAGLPATAPRTDATRATALMAGWLFLGEVELYERGELARLYEASRWTAQRDGQPGTVRQRMHRAPPLRPIWTVIQTDRDGRPVERYWRLPRLMWPGLSVWERRNAAEPYELMGVDRFGTCTPTGFKFKTLEALSRHLHEVQGKVVATASEGSVP